MGACDALHHARRGLSHPKKDVWFEKAQVRDRTGKVISVQQPHVDLELCIGCGICKNKCRCSAGRRSTF